MLLSRLVVVLRGSESVFRRRWIEPCECWHNDKLALQFEAVLAVRSAFNAVISSDKPGSYDATVACSSPLFDLLHVKLHCSCSLCISLNNLEVTLNLH